MMGPNPQMIAQMLLQQHPEIRNNPQQMQMLQAILDNDAQKGTQLANNFCKTYNANPQDATKQAQGFFSNMFNGNQNGMR